MGYYINCIKHSDSLSIDIKELIPDMNLRRRMSRVVKMSVSTAIESLMEFGDVDAIITATGLGCIADSEKFLGNIISADEQMLNPTPFIYSTFNTVGAQVALIRSLNCYNNTFSHRFTGFESALVDAMIRLDNGSAKSVLVGVFDEATSTAEIIMRRMGLLKNKILGEGAVFFVLTAEKTDRSVVELNEVSFDAAINRPAIFVTRTNTKFWCGAMAETLVKAATEAQQPEYYIINDMGGTIHSTITLRCL